MLKRPVAYKVLAESLAKDPSAREQLLAEARAAAALNHPNIVTGYDLGYDGDNAFICMELIEGETYQGILRKKTGSIFPKRFTGSSRSVRASTTRIVAGSSIVT